MTSLLCSASSKGNIPALKYLLSIYNYKEKNLISALEFACISKNVDAVNYLIIQKKMISFHLKNFKNSIFYAAQSVQQDENSYEHIYFLKRYLNFLRTKGVIYNIDFVKGNAFYSNLYDVKLLNYWIFDYRIVYSKKIETKLRRDINRKDFMEILKMFEQRSMIDKLEKNLTIKSKQGVTTKI